MEEFLKAEAADDVLNMMVADMHSVALPALIEAITEAFVPYAYREAEAQFISSFQDVVLDYCSRYPADVCSFLQWWGKNGSALSISVPEDIDAVQVMTIHKSKGLEFKYVVLPEVSQEFGKVPSEWHWVEPASLPVPDGMSLPPYMPVSADDAELADSVHSDIVSHSRDLSDMDIINRLYVAFTRAVDELYILSMRPKRASDGNVGLWLEDFLTAGYSSDGFSQKEPDYSVLSTDSGVVYTIGGRDSEERILSSAGQSDDNEMLITEYYVNGGREMLHYKAEDAPTQSEDAEEEENDPRSEGTLLHEVMAHVETASDLDSSLTASRMKGLLTRSQADEFRNILAPAMDMPEVKGWFDGTKRICNERSILNRFSGNLRPDRLMIDDDGNLIIVDYKFGSSLSHSKYVKQVSRYVRMMKKSGNFTSVKGYLWYVREGRVVPV